MCLLWTPCWLREWQPWTIASTRHRWDWSAREFTIVENCRHRLTHSCCCDFLTANDPHFQLHNRFNLHASSQNIRNSPMKDWQHKYMFPGEEYWSHRLCALWSPEVPSSDGITFLGLCLNSSHCSTWLSMITPLSHVYQMDMGTLCRITASIKRSKAISDPHRLRDYRSIHRSSIHNLEPSLPLVRIMTPLISLQNYCNARCSYLPLPPKGIQQARSAWTCWRFL